MDIRRLLLQLRSSLRTRCGALVDYLSASCTSQSKHTRTRHDIHDHIALELIADCFSGLANSHRRRDVAATGLQYSQHEHFTKDGIPGVGLPWERRALLNKNTDFWYSSRKVMPCCSTSRNSRRSEAGVFDLKRTRRERTNIITTAKVGRTTTNHSIRPTSAVANISNTPRGASHEEISRTERYICDQKERSCRTRRGR